MNTVHVVVPAGIDDPARPSGGNIYDRRMCRELAAGGWTVVEHAVPGAWPVPDDSCAAALAAVLGGLPRGATVLLDGLLAPCVRDPMALAARLALVLLVHMVPRPRNDGGTAGGARSGTSGATRGLPNEVLAAAAAVVATSPWARSRLVAAFDVHERRVHVVEPGVDGAPSAPGTARGGRLLCVAVVTPTKGLDILLEALSGVAGLDWDCTCAGALDMEPAFAADMLRKVRNGVLAGRVHFPGPRNGAALDALYATADVLVLASREESYGMAIAEALVRSIPVIAPRVGGVPGTLGRTASGTVPGIVVAPEDPEALAGAVRAWLGDGALRRRLRAAALERRTELLARSWEAAAGRLAGVLSGAAPARAARERPWDG